MQRHWGFAIAASASLVLIACSAAQPRRGAEEGELSALADRYFEEVFFKYSPTQATQAGLHAYDTQLEDFSRAAIDAQVAALKDFEGRVQAVHVSGRSPDAAADRELLLSDIRSRLLELTTIRRWEKNPDLYSSGISASAFVIMKLREDYHSKAGASFRLREFHDAFLREGFPPVKIIRRAMLGDDSATL